MKRPPFNHNPRPIGSNVPSRRRSDKRWADTQPEHPACGAPPAWFGIDMATGDDQTVVSHHRDGRVERIVVMEPQQRGDAAASLIVMGITVVGPVVLLCWLWWAGHGGKWVSPW